MVCLDTTFIIDLLRNNKEAVSIKEKLEKSSESIAIASPTIIELIRGLDSIHLRKDEENKINNFIDSIIVYPLGKQSAITSGNIHRELSKNGDIIDLEDIMIAGIVLTNNEKLITRNVKHFERIKGLKIEGY